MWIKRKEYDRLKCIEEETLDVRPLKSCSFCGGQASMFTSFGTSIECTKCHAKIYDVDKKTAVKKWERRVGESQ